MNSALEDTIMRYVMKRIGNNPKKLYVIKNGAILSLPSHSISVFLLFYSTQYSFISLFRTALKTATVAVVLAAKLPPSLVAILPPTLVAILPPTLVAMFLTLAAMAQTTTIALTNLKIRSNFLSLLAKTAVVGHRRPRLDFRAARPPPTPAPDIVLHDRKRQRRRRQSSRHSCSPVREIRWSASGCQGPQLFPTSKSIQLKLIFFIPITNIVYGKIHTLTHTIHLD
jgi:hypothetical protein